MKINFIHKLAYLLLPVLLFTSLVTPAQSEELSIERLINNNQNSKVIESKFSIGSSISYFFPSDQYFQESLGSGIKYNIMASRKLTNSLSFLAELGYFKKNNTGHQIHKINQGGFVTYSKFFSVGDKAIELDPNQRSYDIVINIIDIENEKKEIRELEYSMIPLMVNLLFQKSLKNKRMTFSLGFGTGIILASLNESITINEKTNYYYRSRYLGSEVNSSNSNITSIKDNPFGIQIMSDANIKITQRFIFNAYIQYLSARSSSNKFDADLGGFTAGSGLKFLF